MKSTTAKSTRNFFGFTMLLCIGLVLSGCGDSSASKPEGKLKNTQYCKKYKEFEEKVPVVKTGEQLKLLEAVIDTKDFPSQPPSLKQDYELIIDGYKQIGNGTYKTDNQDKYKKASERIQRHAIENCEILVSNSGT